MCETHAAEAAKAVVDEDHRISGKPDIQNFPVLQRRFVTRLIKRSRIVRYLTSGSPAFRILMAGSSISMFGSRISTVAFPMLVLHLNHSPLITGLVAFAAIAPSMLAYVPAGVLVDRWNPRRVMLSSELLRGVAIASVVILLIVCGQRTNIVFLIFAMIAEEILEIFSTLSERRYLSMLMERDKMATRQAYVEVRTHAVVLAGRPIGPFLFEIQPVVPFLADAVSFVVSAASLLVIRRSDEPVRERQRLPPKRLFDDLRGGIGLLRKDHRALMTIVLMAVTSLVAQALILMFLAQAHSKELSTLEVGSVLAASGAGGAAGSFFFKILPSKVRKSWLPIQMVTWSVALFSLALHAHADGLSVFWSVLAMFVLGFTGAIGNIEFGTYILASVADDMIAKITGIGQMMAIGACAFGPVLGGFAVQRYGVKDAVHILLYIVLLLACSSFFTPRARQLAAPPQQLPAELSDTGSNGAELVDNAPNSAIDDQERNVVNGQCEVSHQMKMVDYGR